MSDYLDGPAKQLIMIALEHAGDDERFRSKEWLVRLLDRIATDAVEFVECGLVDLDQLRKQRVPRTPLH